MARITVNLGRERTDAIAASGLTVPELIDRGLAVAEAQQASADGLGAVVVLDTATGRILPGQCKHPQARRDKKSGLCNACGTNVGYPRIGTRESS